MRLPQVDSEHSFPQKLQLKVMSLLMRQPAPDVVKMLLHRADYFGGAFNTLTQQVMRGPSPWSVAERELFAAFVSKQNRCPF
jgi:hypothetical protein